jgi:hypothetical protein
MLSKLIPARVQRELDELGAKSVNPPLPEFKQKLTVELDNPSLT